MLFTFKFIAKSKRRTAKTKRTPAKPSKANANDKDDSNESAAHMIVELILFCILRKIYCAEQENKGEIRALCERSLSAI